jgi:hypothetical protein
LDFHLGFRNRRFTFDNFEQKSSSFSQLREFNSSENVDRDKESSGLNSSLDLWSSKGTRFIFLCWKDLSLLYRVDVKNKENFKK